MYFDPTGDWDEDDGKDTIRKLTLLDVLNSTIDSVDKDMEEIESKQIKDSVALNQFALGTLLDDDPANDIQSKKYTDVSIDVEGYDGFKTAKFVDGGTSGRHVELAEHASEYDVEAQSIFVNGSAQDYGDRNGLNAYFINDSDDTPDSISVNVTNGIIHDGMVGEDVCTIKKVEDYNLTDLFESVVWTYDSATNSFKYSESATE